MVGARPQMSEWIKSKGWSRIEYDWEKDNVGCLTSLQFNQLNGTNLVTLFKFLTKLNDKNFQKKYDQDEDATDI